MNTLAAALCGFVVGGILLWVVFDYSEIRLARIECAERGGVLIVDRMGDRFCVQPLKSSVEWL